MKHDTIIGRNIGLSLAAVLSLVIVSCGTLAEKGTERLLEKAIESESGGDVDIDLDDGGISVSGTGGESIVVGEGASIPDSLTMPVPEGGTVLLSMEVGDGASVTVQYPGNRFEELVSTYDDYFEGQENVTRSESNDPESVSWFAENGFVALSRDTDDTVILSITAGQ